MPAAGLDKRAVPNASAASAPRAFDYLNPELPAGLSRVPMPVIDASPETTVIVDMSNRIIVGGEYILAYATEPARADRTHRRDPGCILLWHANYHPDGGQLFFPLDASPYVVPLALPGDDVRPEDFVCFRFDGRQGLYIHPNVWHEGVFALKGTQRFFDKQGAVHARVSIDFAREFGCLLEAAL